MRGHFIFWIVGAVIIVSEVHSSQKIIDYTKRIWNNGGKEFVNGFLNNKQNGPSRQTMNDKRNWINGNKCPGGYKNGVCMRQCQPTCQGGYCPGPMNCNCYADYEMIGNRCLKKCANTERRDLNTGGCLPTCMPNCIKPGCKTLCTNGWCAGPNYCGCNGPHYQPSRDHQQCEPVCHGCENGHCSAPGNCICSNGYAWNYGRQRCEPQCPAGCVHGKCNRPGFCECDYGYVRHNATVCRLPVCHKPCDMNSKCVRDDKCDCDKGYFWSNDPIYKVPTCKPYCRNSCINGDCVSPNNCICHSGFRYNAQTAICHPVCVPSCINGLTCTRPNQCTCEGGILRNVTRDGTSGTTNVEICVSNRSTWGINPSAFFVLAGIIVSLNTEVAQWM